MTFLTVLCLLTVTASGVGYWWTHWAVEPDLPDFNAGDKKDPVSIGDTADPSGGNTDDFNYIDVDPEVPDYVSTQKKGVYTFLLLGRSDADNYTDMIMLATFDTNTGEVNVASIPRDLMVNVSYDIKKINSTINGGVKNIMKWVRKTLGIQPNFYVLLDWAAVGELVDAVGGVYFTVPFRMHYVDPTPETGFTIDLEEGYQLLDGDKAMQLIRWRKNNVGGTYAPGDSARMELQQRFLKEAAKQVLQPQNILKLGTFATIFTENVQTELTVGNLVWFAQQALKLDSVNKLTFYSLPGNYEVTCWSRTFKQYGDNRGRYQSYVTLYPEKLLDLINTRLNPYERKITLGDLDLMSCTDRHILSSSTGSVADTRHAEAYAEWQAVQNGEAYYDDKGNIVYQRTGDTPNSGETPSDSESPGTEDSTGGERVEGGTGSGTEPPAGEDQGGSTDSGESEVVIDQGSGTPEEPAEPDWNALLGLR